MNITYFPKMVAAGYRDRYLGSLFRVDEPVSVILGKSVITLPTMSRIFKALGVSSATLDLGKGGKVALW